MTFITQHSLIPIFNWLLIVEREYSEYETDTQLKAFCHYQSYSVILSRLEFYSKGTREYPNRCQGIDDTENVLSIKQCLPTPYLRRQGRLSPLEFNVRMWKLLEHWFSLLYFRITWKATSPTNYITDSGGRIKVWVFHKSFQAIPMSVKVENHLLGIRRQWPNNLV